MLRHHVRRAIAHCTILCLLAVHTHAAATAADLGSKGPPPLASQEDNGEFLAHHGCRRIPQPQFDLWGQVVTYLPTWICVSRGVYADTFYPPLLPGR